MMQSPPAQSTHHCWFKVPSLICGKKKSPSLLGESPSRV